MPGHTFSHLVSLLACILGVQVKETVQLLQHREEHHSLVLLSLHARLESEMGVVSMIISEVGVVSIKNEGAWRVLHIMQLLAP